MDNSGAQKNILKSITAQLTLMYTYDLYRKLQSDIEHFQQTSDQVSLCSDIMSDHSKSM